jgi:hypothetical protein
VELGLARRSPSASGSAVRLFMPDRARRRWLRRSACRLMAAPIAAVRPQRQSAAAPATLVSGRRRILLVRARIGAYLLKTYHYAPVYYVIYLVNLEHFI